MLMLFDDNNIANLSHKITSVIVEALEPEKDKLQDIYDEVYIESEGLVKWVNTEITIDEEEVPNEQLEKTIQKII